MKAARGVEANQGQALGMEPTVSLLDGIILGNHPDTSKKAGIGVFFFRLLALWIAKHLRKEETVKRPFFC